LDSTTQGADLLFQETTGATADLPADAPTLDHTLLYGVRSHTYRKPYGVLGKNFRRGLNSSVSSNVGPQLRKYQFWTNICDDTICWPHPEIGKVEKSLYSACSLQDWNIPVLKDSSFECHLLAFKEKLKFWELILENRTCFMPPIEVARRSILLGPEFPKSIKDSIEHSLRYRTSSVDDCEFTDVYEDAWGHDYFFSPRDCLNFRIPEDNDDIERLLVEPPPIDPLTISLFKEKVRENIKVPPHKVDLDDLDYLGMFTQTSTFDSPGSRKTRHKNYLSRLGKKIKPAENLEFEYVAVQKNAAETRAAVVPSPESLYQIKKFHKMFKAVADCPEDQYHNPRVLEGLEDFLSIGYSRKTGFIMTDIKKSGLTFNRNLHNAIIEVLHEEMPTWGWDFFLDYGNAHVTLPYRNSRHKVKNGYGLGMMDCVISFSQAIVYNMWLDNTDLYGYRLTGKFWSDDSLIKVRSSPDHDIDEDKMKTIMDSFNGYARKCGLVIHDEKPYYSKKGVFLETYGTHYKDPWDHTKVVQYLGCLFDTLKAPSIYRAKEMFAALTLEVPQSLKPWLSTAMDIIIPFWGYELHKDEIHVPFEMGGWMYSVEEGFNLFCETAQDYESQSECDLVKMCLWTPPRPRLLKAHKDHKEWIQSIVDLGWSDDPTPHSWKKVASATLKQDYKHHAEVADREKRILKSRLDFFEKSKKDKSITEYGAILEFWKNAKKGGWYLPPKAAVSIREHSPLDYKPYKDSNNCSNRISVQRAWLYLTKAKGSKLDICDPFVEYASRFDVCSRMINSLSGAKHMHLDNIVFLLVNGFSESSIIDKLEERYGIGAYLKDPGPGSQEVRDMISEIMSITQGDYVFPLRGTPFSILTRLQNEDYISRWKSWDCIDGFGLAYAIPDRIGFEEFASSIPIFAQELSLELKKCREGWSLPTRTVAPVTTSVNPEADRVRQDLSYAISMMAGFSAQAVLALNPESYNGNEAAALAMEGDVGYDSDVSFGDMFG